MLRMIPDAGFEQDVAFAPLIGRNDEVHRNPAMRRQHTICSAGFSQVQGCQETRPLDTRPLDTFVLELPISSAEPVLYIPPRENGPVQGAQRP